MPISKSTKPINFTLTAPHVLPDSIKSILLNHENRTNYLDIVLYRYDPDVTCVVSIYTHTFKYLVATYDTHYVNSEKPGSYHNLKHKDFAEYLLLYQS